MTKTVVGLFDNAQDAQDVVNDLYNLGFSSSDVELISQGSFSGNESTIVDRLTSEGVPSDDAQLYLQGIRSGSSLVIAQTDDSRVNEVVDVMNRHNIVDLESRRGSYTNLETDTAVVGTTATTGVDTSYTDTTRTTDVDTAYTGTTTGPRSELQTGEEAVIPVTEEELRVGKRDVERGGVRVDVDVEEVPVEEQVTLRDETVRVERRPASGTASTADVDAFQEGTFEVRERDEEAVVDKQARVVEEVVIGKDVEERTETVSDTVRRTDVDVQETGTGRVSGTTGTTTGYGTTGTTYDETSRERGLTDRIEDKTGFDIDRDGDVGGRPRNT